MSFLKNLTKEMSEQDNRATQYPLFIIQSKVERALPDGCGESVRKPLDDIDSKDLCERCLNLYENDEDLPDSCISCDPNCFWDRAVEYEPDLNAGVFFTAKAAEAHIKANYYHYNEPRVYGIGAWRNPEMVRVMQLLFTLAGREIPSCYQ